MTTRVVDASVVAKWILPEAWSREAGLLRHRTESLIGPDVLWLEVSRIILRKARRADLTVAQAMQAWELIQRQTILKMPLGDLTQAAFEIGLAHQRDSFDAVYVALALRERCTFVTADRVLYDALATIYPDTMIWVGDLPRVLDAPL